jgi:Pentapeptide repeats (8 copies)
LFRASPDHVAQLLKGTTHWNAWRRDNYTIDPELGRARLDRANLTRALLIKADLGGANLSGANLSKAKFREGSLRGANLVGANLSDADFRGADLSDAPLQNPTLQSQFIMVSIDTDARGESDYYVGVPDQTFLADFDGFEIVAETDLPREIDAVLYADQSSENFTRRFRLRREPDRP